MSRQLLMALILTGVPPRIALTGIPPGSFSQTHRTRNGGSFDATAFGRGLGLGRDSDMYTDPDAPAGDCSIRAHCGELAAGPACVTVRKDAATAAERFRRNGHTFYGGS